MIEQAMPAPGPAHASHSIQLVTERRKDWPRKTPAASMMFRTRSQIRSVRRTVANHSATVLERRDIGEDVLLDEMPRCPNPSQAEPSGEIMLQGFRQREARRIHIQARCFRAVAIRGSKAISHSLAGQIANIMTDSVPGKPPPSKQSPVSDRRMMVPPAGCL